jgi:hypothetical protein
MMNDKKPALLLTALLSLAITTPLLAHCDSMDGPVIKDAQRALGSGDVAPVLKWVSAQDEDAIRKVFALTTSIRGQGEDARQVADKHFFETLVSIHRASEGEGFTGLKPEGSVTPAIAATDRALAEGNIDELAGKIAAAVRDGIEKRFRDAYEKRLLAEDSVARGREYVEAYVQLTHFVEAIHHTVSHGASHKHQDSE